MKEGQSVTNMNITAFGTKSFFGKEWNGRLYTHAVRLKANDYVAKTGSIRLDTGEKPSRGITDTIEGLDASMDFGVGHEGLEFRPFLDCTITVQPPGAVVNYEKQIFDVEGNILLKAARPVAILAPSTITLTHANQELRVQSLVFELKV